MREWYYVQNINTIDTPALLIYKHRVLQNIQTAIEIIKDAQRLRPHVKTYKNIEATALMMKAGITKFKCATIAEAEMLGMAAANDVLLAYQPLGPKLSRLITLVKTFPATKFSCLTDDIAVAETISTAAVLANLVLTVFIDVNVGMNRTGVLAGQAALLLYKNCAALPGLRVAGVHMYDGHIRDSDIAARTKASNIGFEQVATLQQQLVASGYEVPIIIAGGSPTFPIHAARPGVECSPGTFIYWDETYQTLCPEQPFVPAALVVSRVISHPAENIFCADLGHKSIASESALNKRVKFLNTENVDITGHSEEHLILHTINNNAFKTGDVLYGLPWHICPTVALYDKAFIVEDGFVTEEWPIIARNRKITI